MSEDEAKALAWKWYIRGHSQGYHAALEPNTYTFGNNPRREFEEKWGSWSKQKDEWP